MAEEDTKSIKSTKSTKSKKDEKVGEEEEDQRLEFILAYFTKSYRLKQEKWNKMIAIEENKVTLSFNFSSIKCTFRNLF